MTTYRNINSKKPYAVINQMDTSQAHLSSKAQGKDPHKPDNLSKEELTAVLKYGAQKMFVNLRIPFIRGEMLTNPV